MAYKSTVEEQAKFDYEFFKERLEFIESQFKDDVLKYIKGKFIYVLLDGMYEATYFVKTTVSDLQYVTGNNIDFDFMVNPIGYNNCVVYSVKEPNKKSFRGKIKYTPKNTLSLTVRWIAKKENGKMSCCGIDNMPILQDEKFLVSACDNLFENDEAGADYDYIERHAFRFLTDDKRIACGEDWKRRQPEAALEDSQMVHRGLCQYYDVVNSWGVCYQYAGNCFIFPLKREYIQEIFKRRDKENGRRRVIASLVRDYKRKDGTEVDRHLRTTDSFSIDGRTFNIYVGMEDFDNMYADNEKSKKRLKKEFDNSEIVGNLMVRKHGGVM